MADSMTVNGAVPFVGITRRELHGIAWGLAAAMLTAGWWVMTRLGVTTTLDQYDVAALRFATSGLLMLPVLWRCRREIAAVRPSLLAVMVLCAGIPYSLVAGTGLRFASAANGGALVSGMMPLFAAVLSTLVLKENIGPGRCLGLGIVVAGVLGIGGAAAASATALPLFILASLMWASFTIVLRRTNLAPFAAVSFVCCVSGAVYVPSYLMLSDQPMALTVPLSDMLPQVLYQGLLSAVVAVYCFARAVMLLGPARASVFGALVPVLACLMGAAFLAEVPTAAEVLSIATIAAGAALASGAVRIPVRMPAQVPAMR
ncbi:MAG TPA: DMT family transporter [Arenibaculum sp.]|nr:DMT family transporter [Arenibaculum sp.]